MTASYLLASPDESACLVRLALTDDPFVETKSMGFSSDGGVAVDLFNDFVIIPTTRLGIVKLIVGS